MLNSIKKSLLPALAAVAMWGFTSCDGNDPEIAKIETPTTYSFERNGASTVAYDGQLSRIAQLKEMKAYLAKGDAGQTISAQALKDMYANKDGNGGGNFSTAYDKQLKDKTFEFDQSYFEGLMDKAAAASVEGNKGTQAASGKAGLIKRSNNNTILVDENGFEFTQLIEKGLMGAVMYYQICEVYLTDSKIGNTVNNDKMVDGKNYTDMEHHWDEAFGYFGVPVDFPTNKAGLSFWGNYSNGRNTALGSADKLMAAFLAGRTAIVNKEYGVRDAQRDIIYAELEKVSAATAIHYINEALKATNDGDRLHVLSEARAFTLALKYNNRRGLTLSEITTIVDTNIGTNLWSVTETGLKAARTKLATTYGLTSMAETL